MRSIWLMWRNEHACDFLCAAHIAVMSVEDLKRQADTLSVESRDELFFHLAKLRNRDDPTYWPEIRERIADKNPDHWLTPEQVAQRLDDED